MVALAGRLALARRAGYSLGNLLRGNCSSQGAQLFAGAVAGAFSSLVLAPTDAIKIRAQLDGSGALPALRRLLLLGGVPELFRALGPTMMRMIPASAVRTSCTAPHMQPCPSCSSACLCMY